VPFKAALTVYQLIHSKYTENFIQSIVKCHTKLHLYI
jgi:hypothetical protein